MRDLKQASDKYEQAEADFLGLLRRRASWTDLATATQTVAVASAEFNRLAFEAYYAGAETAWMPLDHLTERTEVLANLWADIAAAYRGSVGAGRRGPGRSGAGGVSARRDTDPVSPACGEF